MYLAHKIEGWRDGWIDAGMKQTKILVMTSLQAEFIGIYKYCLKKIGHYLTICFRKIIQ